MAGGNRGSREFVMSKINRNDPCPSGTGQKFKKCLFAHPCLENHPTAAAIWWVCDRWQTELPDLEDLRETLTGMKQAAPGKLAEFLDRLLAEVPTDPSPWLSVIRWCNDRKHPELEELVRWMLVRLPLVEESERQWILCNMVELLAEDHPGMLPDLLEATLRLDPATTEEDSVLPVFGLARRLGRDEDCERLRARFPHLPEDAFEVADDNEASAGEANDDDFPPLDPKTQAALEKVWSGFEAISKPSAQQAETFVDELLALPHHASDWHEVFSVAMRSRSADPLKILERLASSLSREDCPDLSFVCWSAVEHVVQAGQAMLLPRIAATMIDYNSDACDPDALSHIADALLANGYVAQTERLLSTFLPALIDNDDLVPWVIPHVANQIFMIRLGLWIASGDAADTTEDDLLAVLSEGIDTEICPENARRILKHALAAESSLSRDDFLHPLFAASPDEEEIRVNRIRKAFVEVAKDGHLSDQCHPSVTLIGLHMLVEAVASWHEKQSVKKRKHPHNLLEFLEAARMDRLVALECAGLLGVRLDQARVMIGACITLARAAERWGLLSDLERRNLHQGLTKLFALTHRARAN